MMKEQAPTFEEDDCSIALSDHFDEDLEDVEADDDTVGHKAHQKQERKQLTKTVENKAVSCVRLVVYLVVLITAIIVSCGVYIYTSNNERREFATQFDAYAIKLLESFHDSVERKIGAIHTFAASITSYALATGASFPNMTMPNFEIEGGNARIQSGAVVINWLPYVTNETRAGWEAYASENRQWINPAFLKDMGYKAAQDVRFGYDNDGTRQRQRQLGGEQEEDGYHYKIYSVVGDDETEPYGPGTGPFLPLWQMSPVLPLTEYLNFNILSHGAIKDSFAAAVASEKIIVSKAHDLKDPEDPDDETTGIYNAYLTFGQFRHQQVIYQGDPTADVIHPVFDSFGPNKTFAGLLSTPIYWRQSLENILPESANGIICVMKNTQNQSFSYRIDGPDVTYLGKGDHHDGRFDGMMIWEDVNKQIQNMAGPENQGYDAPELDMEHCRYTLYVYPSAMMEEGYLTNQPVAFTAVVASIFFFTSLIFILYDLLVARRQQIVMQKAVESSALVSSLYPKQVRDRLFEESHSGGRKSRQWEVQNVPTTANDLSKMDHSLASNTNTKAIAEYYEHSTIMFADLAGFTAWSAKRQPQEVFTLLENLYQAFDRIAARRGVFKVETIGDCYVAVTGCPDPQPDHAVIMCKFATLCINKLGHLLPSLAEMLGQDTLSLQLRVGLHSGPITGGVLRGQKSRFQLFGNSINAASRMETTGVKGRIHCSQDTADELIAHGYERWLERRKDKVFAKGLGELTTYFVRHVTTTKSLATRSVMSADTTTSTKSEEEIIPVPSPHERLPQQSTVDDAMPETNVEI